MALLPPTPPSLSIPSRLFTQAEAKSFHPREVTDGTSSSSENVGKRDIKKKIPPPAPPSHALFLPLLPLKNLVGSFSSSLGSSQRIHREHRPQPQIQNQLPTVYEIGLSCF